jgi:hypothetical protein
MPKGYARRVRGLFDPLSAEPYRISRSKIDLFVDCPRCFWLDQRLGIARPSFPAFSLNNAVDELLKREFDAHREEGTPHPIMREHHLEAVPLQDPRLEEWRDALRRGVQYHHTKHNLILRGGVDDIWKHKNGELIVVDYKATSKKEVPTIEGYWQQGYKRQVEIYQWLLRGIGEKVSSTAYFVYVNGRSNDPSFGGRLNFDTHLISYAGDDSWIEETVGRLAATLRSEEAPDKREACEYCGYRETAGKELLALKKKP